MAEQQAAHGARFKTPEHPQDGTAGFFVIEIEAQEASVEYRSPLAHPKPNMTIEHAIVVTQQGSEAWTNERNQVRVHFAWDRKNPDGTFASSPLLSTMQADTGNGYGAVHVPRAGEWVLVAYWANDCDKPFILGRVNGGTTPSQWHSNVLLSGFLHQHAAWMFTAGQWVADKAHSAWVWVDEKGHEIFRYTAAQLKAGWEAIVRMTDLTWDVLTHIDWAQVGVTLLKGAAIAVAIVVGVAIVILLLPELIAIFAALCAIIAAGAEAAAALAATLGVVVGGGSAVAALSAS
ncbi:hypothetical protein AQ610_14385 [Burkholderia humptydooensis]|nr:hypothetical protein AQ610_14385 [Burkholderia humptydooensis]